ncbi:ABC transporter permease [Tropicimonas sp. S265A]|uniref:ABC transporter permease n=1 Tax=Tropicimonas sp. S265A TaxID=3415134 RepID=UPI003C7B061F
MTMVPPAPALPVRKTRGFAPVRAIGALILREMSTSYGRSPGGYLWAVLEPAAGIILLTAVFSLGFHAPPLGTNFPFFYATGIIPFLMYADISGKLGTALLFSKQLLAYPTVTYMDALIARFVLNGLTQLAVAALLLGGLLLAFETQTVLAFDQLALAGAMTLALALGVGVMNCLLISIMPVWQRIWAILMRPLFIASCIFFTFETVPLPYREMLWWLPTVHLSGMTRAAFYPGYDASYVSPTYVFAISLILLGLGVVFLKRYGRDAVHA